MEFYFKTYCLPVILGCVPLILNYILSKTKEKRDNQRRFKFLVVNVAAWLEDYSLWTIRIFREWSSYLLVRSERPDEMVTCFIQQRPDDVDWTVLDVSMMNEIFTFANFLKIASNTLESQDDKYGSVEILERLLFLWSTGQHAYSIALRLRKLVADQSPHHEYYTKSFRQMGEEYSKYKTFNEDGYFEQGVG